MVHFELVESYVEPSDAAAAHVLAMVVDGGSTVSPT